MNAREMADIMLTWPDGMAANERKFFRALARRFPHEGSRTRSTERTRQMEQDLGLSGQPHVDG
jgi:hypothetical protein